MPAPRRSSFWETGDAMMMRKEDRFMRMSLLCATQIVTVLSTSAGAETTALSEGRSLQAWYEMGGPVMHGLSLLSVLTLALGLERGWALRRRAIAPRKVLRSLDRDDFVPAQEGSSSLDRILWACRSRSSERRTHAQRVGDAEVAEMHRNLPTLAALGNVATMLGLFGTVLGMISAFEQIAQVGVGNAAIVAEGIFEALVTTAAGLGIGIAAFTLHTLYRRKVEAYCLEIEELVSEWLEPSRSRARTSMPMEPAEAQEA